MPMTRDMKEAAKRGTVRCYDGSGAVVYGRNGKL